MEPLFFKAENYRRNRRTSARAPRASMEPLFFKAENRGVQTAPKCASSASMEPLFFKAENTQQPAG